MLTVIAAPMFAGKTSRLISICTSNIIAGNNVVVFKPSNDNRYDAGNFIVSHNLDKFNAVPLDINLPGKAHSIIYSMIPLPALVAFDECQFFDKFRFEQLITQLLYIEKIPHIVCAGLSQDSDGKPFGAMPYLMSIADEVISLKAVCSVCKKIDGATRTFRKSTNDEQVLIGGSEIYEPRCYTCWIGDT